MSVDRVYQAVNLVRYSVPSGTRIIVQEGLCMIVTKHFLLRGTLVLGGILKLGGAP